MKCENKPCFLKLDMKIQIFNQTKYFFLLNLHKKKLLQRIMLCFFLLKDNRGERNKTRTHSARKGFLKARINSNIWAFGSIIQDRYMQVTSSRKDFLHCVLSLVLVAPSSFCNLSIFWVERHFNM